MAARVAFAASFRFCINAMIAEDRDEATLWIDMSLSESLSFT